MKTTIFLIVAALALSGCTPQIINDTGNHLQLEVSGMNDGVMDKANTMANGRCAMKGLVASAPTVHETGWPVHTWYIEYDCVKQS